MPHLEQTKARGNPVVVTRVRSANIVMQVLFMSICVSGSSDIMRLNDFMWLEL